MALRAHPWNFPAAFSLSSHSSSDSVLLLVSQSRTRHKKSKRSLKTKTQRPPTELDYVAPSKNRNPTLSFFEQIQLKLSMQEESESTHLFHIPGIMLPDSEASDRLASRSRGNFFVRNPSASHYLARGGKTNELHFNSESEFSDDRLVKKEIPYLDHKCSQLYDMTVNHERLKNTEKGIDTSSRVTDGETSNTVMSSDAIVKDVSLNDISTFSECSRDDNNCSTKLLDVKYGSLIQGGGFKMRNNSRIADRSVSQPELERLRRISLRMLDRLEVGKAGITQSLVDSIHDKWQVDEVVKLKFEGSLSVHMKMIDELLERITGGLIIWRSGSSVVLYRGISYKLRCVQNYTKQTQVYDSVGTDGSSLSNFSKQGLKLFGDGVAEVHEFDKLSDPSSQYLKNRFGRDRMPIDADLLPSVVPGYQPPFRLLPYGVRRHLRDTQITSIQGLASRINPHFELGRSRELQGLAMEMVKQWEKCDITKIAIKRGVQNTCIDKMAEEIMKLTGGTLISQSKECIVIYRGNDFLPPTIVRNLIKHQKLSDLQQDKEENVRKDVSAFIVSIAKKPFKNRFVAGTLAETATAASRWGRTQPTSNDIEEMKRDLNLARHASLIRHFERRLSIANEKMNRADKALAKLQQDLKPAELPRDLETITEEERCLFRKLGLTMRPYLPLGRRVVFDGVILNMHLHWKYHEVVKIIVKRKSVPQIKHIAISLEAESGGVLVSIDETPKGTVIILYRGKNYEKPMVIKPKNLLTKNQALARALELQRREALKHYIVYLHGKIRQLESKIERIGRVKKIGEKSFRKIMKDASYPFFA